jgi:hypothetical protein
MGGWIWHRASALERCFAIAGGLLLMYARLETDAAGILCVAIAIGFHLWRTNNVKR